METISQTGFLRSTGRSPTLGKAVIYTLAGFQFRMIVTRDGMLIEGRTPPLTPEGMDILLDVVQRCIIHQQHLASFKLDDAQTILEEDEVKKNVSLRMTPFNPLPLASAVKLD